MATYSYTTSATEDAALAHVLALTNAVRAEQGLRALTADAFMKDQMQGLLASFTVTKATDDERDLRSAYTQADAVKQAEVRQSLGLA